MVNTDLKTEINRSVVSYRNLPSYHMPMHHHEEVQILIPLEGSHFEITWFSQDKESESKHLMAADICLIPPLLEHEVNWSNTANFVNIKITPAFIRDYQDTGFTVDETIFDMLLGFEDAFLFHLGRAIRSNFLQAGKSNYKYAQAVLGIVTQHILDTCLRGDVAPVMYNDYAQIPCEKIRDAILYISNNLDRNLSIETIADQVGMSHYHFMRVFKEMVGMPASRFHTMQRIEKAKTLLRHNERIVDIAHALGYSSQAHFSNVFSRSVGMTPRKFRLHSAQQA